MKVKLKAFWSSMFHQVFGVLGDPRSLHVNMLVLPHEQLILILLFIAAAKRTLASPFQPPISATHFSHRLHALHTNDCRACCILRPTGLAITARPCVVWEDDHIHPGRVRILGQNEVEVCEG